MARRVQDRAHSTNDAQQTTLTLFVTPHVLADAVVEDEQRDRRPRCGVGQECNAGHLGPLGRGTLRLDVLHHGCSRYASSGRRRGLDRSTSCSCTGKDGGPGGSELWVQVDERSPSRASAHCGTLRAGRTENLPEGRRWRLRTMARSGFGAVHCREDSMYAGAAQGCVWAGFVFVGLRAPTWRPPRATGPLGHWPLGHCLRPSLIRLRRSVVLGNPFLHARYPPAHLLNACNCSETGVRIG